MTDEEIFDLAEKHGWQDDFGRWNLPEDGLISFALALLKAEREACANVADSFDPEKKRSNYGQFIARQIRSMGEAEKPWVKSYCGGKPNYTTPVDGIDISQERVDETAKHEHEFFCPRCGHCCREWVGLTEDEKQFFKAMGFSGIDIVEAKLKEKNT